MDSLPNEIVLILFNSLDARSCCRLAMTSKRLYDVYSTAKATRSTSFENASYLTTTGLRDFLSTRSDKIESLSVRNCHWLSLPAAKTSWRDLRVLALDGMHATVARLLDVMSNFRRLETLSIRLSSELHRNESALVQWRSKSANLVKSELQRTLRTLSVAMYHVGVTSNFYTRLFFLQFFPELRRFQLVTIFSDEDVGSSSLWDTGFYMCSTLHVATPLLVDWTSSHCTSIDIWSGPHHFAVDRVANHTNLKELVRVLESQKDIRLLSSVLLASRSCLTSLRLSKCRLTDSFCEALLESLNDESSRVVELDLSHNDDLTFGSLSTLSSCPTLLERLTKLWLAGNWKMFYGDVDYLVSIIERCLRLEVLDIFGIFAFKSFPFPAVEHKKICASLARLSRLRRLHASPEVFFFPTETSRVGHESIESVVRGTRLSHVSIEALRSAQAQLCRVHVLCPLAKFSLWSNLRSLVIRKIRQLTDFSGLPVITKNCTGLRELILDNLGITSHSTTLANLIQALRHCRKLERLGLMQTYLDFSPTFADSLCCCVELRYCRLELIKGRVPDHRSVIKVFESARKLMVFHLFTALKHAHCTRLRKILQERFTRESLHFVIGNHPNEVNKITGRGSHATAEENMKAWLEQVEWHKSP